MSRRSVSFAVCAALLFFCASRIGVAQAPEPPAFAAAMEVPAADVVSAEFDGASTAQSRRIAFDYGSTIRPRAGTTMIMLSSGVAADQNDPGFVAPQPGSDHGRTILHMFGQANKVGCPAPLNDPTAYDLTSLKLTLTVPAGTIGLSFDFSFFSAEYPEYVCSQFGDRFVAWMERPGFAGNIAFDSLNNPVTGNFVHYTVRRAGLR